VAKDPATIARYVHELAVHHAGGDPEGEGLYRIFFYDSMPLDTIIVHPVTKKRFNMKQTPEYAFRKKLHKSLAKLRKVALRLGRVDVTWRSSGYTLSQKQVDMKIGMDVASLAYKRLVDCIVLMSGDSDFVPAAKLARREGIDFILDPLGQRVKDELEEHVDAIRDLWLSSGNGLGGATPAIVGAGPGSALTEALACLSEDQVIHGKVLRILKKAVVVDIGEGIHGFLHIANISWRRVGRVTDHLNIGDELDLKILSIDRRKGRVSLGLKQMSSDPEK